MNGRWVAGVLVAAILGAALFGAGFWVGQVTAPAPAASAAWPRAGAWGMMQGPGMMGGGMTRRGMMGGLGFSTTPQSEPLSIDEAREAVERFLGRLGDDNLVVGEIMVFDNHAYAEILKADTGLGAMEVLVDPVSRVVHLEYGPAMMWNTEYAMMGRRSHGMMGGMMGLERDPLAPDVGEPQVSAEQAREIAQEYLDQNLAGVEVGEEADVFPGYYTLHTLKEGKVLGMLSVNAYSGQVWIHTWHGAFVEMSEEHE